MFECSKLGKHILVLDNLKNEQCVDPYLSFLRIHLNSNPFGNPAGPRQGLCGVRALVVWGPICTSAFLQSVMSWIATARRDFDGVAISI